MSIIQIIQDPEGFKESLLSEFRKEIQILKKEFQPKEPTTYLTRKEVAEMLSINLTTLWSWTKSGKLRAFSIGNRVFYRRSDVENALQPLNEVE